MYDRDKTIGWMLLNFLPLNSSPEPQVATQFFLSFFGTVGTWVGRDFATVDVWRFRRMPLESCSQDTTSEIFLA